ncbi:MAG: peptide ABC transporter substrate-binding protein [Verrucomicrobia bacterium]|nr:peptide ABC transporter substrate-binding protein [Verrucomicrobiota bacterium]
MGAISKRIRPYHQQIKGMPVIDLRSELYLAEDLTSPSASVALHPAFYPTYERLKRWLDRFSFNLDESMMNDLLLVQLLAKKKYLDHRSPTHLFRLVLSIYHMRKKLLSSATFNSHVRHVAARWIPTNLIFPFSSKPVLGCLIGFNVMDRCELFDEENVVIALQKHFPELQLVKESYYQHTSQHEDFKLFYFEIEKKNGSPFSFVEQKRLKNNLESKIRNSIQQLSPSVFMNLNVEEVYKNLLLLSQEIHSIHDLPQVYITLDQHTGKEIAFQVILVQISPFHRFSLKERLFGCNVILERMVPVRSLESRPIDAYIFRLFLPRDPSLLRSDGSLDFYTARQKVVSLLTGAVGELRDYNGGLLIKQQELLFSLKKSLIEKSYDTEFIENFFYAIVPIEKQALLDPKVLSMLFIYFSEHRREKVTNYFSLNIYPHDQQVFLIVHSDDPSISPVISSVVEEQALKMKEWASNSIETTEGFFFNCALLDQNLEEAKLFIDALQESLVRWREKKKNQQILRIGLTHSIYSLDPRIGGEAVSSDVLKFLFEGLTRFDQEGHIENGVAESIEVSSNLKEYTFKLRICLWNNGSIVSAHDFAYAWKKILSPGFKTNFAHLFYPIKYAREAREGRASPEEIGIYALDDQTLRVELARPIPYFLQLTALPLFSPIHRLVDQDCPQWPYQSEKNYPCNGPFQLKINQPNQGYQLIKNPLYWDASHIVLDQVILKKIDPFRAVQAFAENEIDWLGNPFGVWHSNYSAEERQGRIVARPQGWVGWSVFNASSFPFNQRKLRQALAFAIDRSQLIKGAFLPLTPAYSILPSSDRGQESSDFPEFDIEKAQQLFQEASKELGLLRQDLAFTLIFSQTGIQEHIARGFKEQLEQHLGLTCYLQALPWAGVFRRMTEGKFQMALTHWTSCVEDPIYTLDTFKYASEGVNFAKWEHPEFQRLLDLSEEAINPFQRSLHLRQATEIISEEMPILPLFDQPYQALVNKKLVIHEPFCFGLSSPARCYYKKGGEQ